MKSLPDLVLDGLKDPTKQTKACELRFKQPQNGARLNPKPAPRNKRNKIKKNHRKEDTYKKKKKKLVRIRNEANKRMDTLDMPWKVAWSVKAKTIKTRGISHKWGTQRKSHNKKSKNMLKTPKKQKFKQQSPQKNPLKSKNSSRHPPPPPPKENSWKKYFLAGAGAQPTTMVGPSNAKVELKSAYLWMEELASGSSCDAHHNFPMVTRCHALQIAPLSFLHRWFWLHLIFPPLPRSLINPHGASAFSSPATPERRDEDRFLAVWDSLTRKPFLQLKALQENPEMVEQQQL